MPGWRQPWKYWPLLLGAAYLALIPVLIALESVLGVTLLLIASAVICLLVWYGRSVGRSGATENSSRDYPPSAAVKLRDPLGASIDALRAIPPLVLWLPLPLSLSWVAAEMARVPQQEAHYYEAFGLWLVALLLFVAILLIPPAIENRLRMPQLVRAISWPEVAAVAFITAVAFAVRFIDLADLPGPFWADEGDQAIAGLEVARGIRTNLFDMGSETVQPNIYHATIGIPFKLFGPSIVWARLPTVIAGTATVALLYLLLRELTNRRVALAGAAFLAVLNVHVHYSRMAFPNPYDAFFAVLILYFAFRAIRTESSVDFGLAGLSAGLVIYFFMGGRVVLLALAVLLAYMVLKTRGAFLFQNFWGWGVMLAGFVVAFLPAALYFDGTPGAFTSRWESQNIFDTGGLDELVALTGHSSLHVIWDQFQQTIGTLVVYDDTIAHYNSQVPLLDGLSAVFLVIGGVYALLHVFQPRFFALYALLLLTVIFGNTLLGPPVGSHRMLAAMPVLAAFVGLGLVIAAEAVVTLAPRLRSAAPVIVVGVLAIIGFMNLSFYFDTYPDTGNFGRGRHLAGADVADYLESFDSSYGVFILDTGGLTGRGPAMLFRSRDKVIVDVREDGTGKTFIEGRPIRGEELAESKQVTENALFLVPINRTNGPPEHVEEFKMIKESCPGGVTSEVFNTGAGDVIEYVWYEVRDGQQCIERLRGTVLPPLEI